MSDSDETRQLLQSRTTVLFKLMFWSFGALAVFIGLQYTIFPEHAPRHRHWVYAGSAVGRRSKA